MFVRIPKSEEKEHFGWGWQLDIGIFVVLAGLILTFDALGAGEISQSDEWPEVAGVDLGT